MERTYDVEIKYLSTRKVKEIVPIRAHSKKQAREYCTIIYRLGKYSGKIVGKAYEHKYN